MEYGIRPATSTDRDAVEEIVAAAYRPWVPVVGSRPAPMDADYRRLIAQGQVHVACSEAVTSRGVPVGVIVLVPEPGTLLVENVAVRPQVQGRGVGRVLLSFAEEHARRLGLPSIRLYTHEKMTTNIGLYEAVGYRRTGVSAVPGGRLVHMIKPLGGRHGAAETAPPRPTRQNLSGEA
jgi:ribosomal protein S18 acetylase RimI-like enzyme